MFVPFDLKTALMKKFFKNFQTALGWGRHKKQDPQRPRAPTGHPWMSLIFKVYYAKGPF